jgi:acyl-CoA synthetase (AMP-forming)/AMP-acid ligase II/acyl carrier protein
MNHTDDTSSLVAVLRQYAQTHSHFPIFNYLEDGEQNIQTLTYADFDAKARQVAAHLQQQQLKGERVLLLFPQGLEYLIALFGCFYAGVIAVPAYPPRNNRNLQRLEAIMKNSGATTILADQAGIEHMVKMKKDFSAYQLFAVESFLNSESNYREEKVAAEDIAYLQYTSGSTGNPKGVIVRHGNMLHNIGAQEEIFHPHTLKHKTFVTWAPMYHDMGLLSMMTAMKNQSTCYFMAPVHFVQHPARWLRAISKFEAYYTLAPNFAFDFCCERIQEEDLEGVDLSTLRAVTNGSERVRLDTLQRFSEKFAPWGFRLQSFCPAYGMAETTLIVSTIKGVDPIVALPKDQEGNATELSTVANQVPNPESYLVSAGRPVADMTVAIVSPENGQELEPGLEGEVWVSSPGSVTTGYWNNEAATSEAFGNTLPDREGHLFLRTGDLGFVKYGQLYITGRLKDMVIIRGRNYYPQDIEYAVQESHDALETHSGAAFALDGQLGEQLVVVQEVRRQYLRTANTEEIFEAIRAAVAQEMDILPGRIVLIMPLSLPKTSSGKIQRFLAKEQLLAGTLRVVAEWESVPVRGAVEAIQDDEINQASITRWLVSNLAAKAKVAPEEIDLSRSVRDYPLESVDAIFLADELSQWLDISVSAEVFWSLPSIEELAVFLEKKHYEDR